MTPLLLCPSCKQNPKDEFIRILNGSECCLPASVIVEANIKGRHKASLNFGDCLVYATAQHLNVPLLYKGNDFVHTDLRLAAPCIESGKDERG